MVGTGVLDCPHYALSVAVGDTSPERGGFALSVAVGDTSPERGGFALSVAVGDTSPERGGYIGSPFGTRSGVSAMNDTTVWCQNASETEPAGETLPR